MLRGGRVPDFFDGYRIAPIAHWDTRSRYWRRLDCGLVVVGWTWNEGLSGHEWMDWAFRDTTTLLGMSIRVRFM